MYVRSKIEEIDDSRCDRRYTSRSWPCLMITTVNRLKNEAKIGVAQVQKGVMSLISLIKPTVGDQQRIGKKCKEHVYIKKNRRDEWYKSTK